MATVRNSLRQAITTKYHGPSNVKGARVSATCGAGRIIRSWDHSLNADQNHDAACAAMVDKLGWGGEWVGGGTAAGYLYVDVSR